MTTYFESRDAALHAFETHVSKSKADFFKAFGMDVVMGRREGVYFWDVDGRRFLNAHCNGGVFNLGHRHPVLVDVLRRALDDWDIGNHHLLSEARAALAARLAGLLPGDIDHALFAVGGGEAVDAALKMSRGLTGRSGVVSAYGGYHGHTGLAMATGDAKYREPFGPQPSGFAQVPFGDIDALDAAVGDETAAVILEAVPATLGVVVPDAGYMSAVREICDRRGALFVLDEVQTAFGRTGAMFAAEHWDIVPDFVVVGKALSGGLVPIAATCYRGEHHRIFEPDPFIHVSTFGGAEDACAVSLAMLDIVADAGFLADVRARGDELGAGIDAVSGKRPAIVEGVNRLGMMAGVRCTRPEIGLVMCKALFDAGTFAVYSNNDKRVVQYLLPLISDADVVGAAVDAVADAAAAVESDPTYTGLVEALEGSL